MAKYDDDFKKRVLGLGSYFDGYRGVDPDFMVDIYREIFEKDEAFFDDWGRELVQDIISSIYNYLDGNPKDLLKIRDLLMGKSSLDKSDIDKILKSVLDEVKAVKAFAEKEREATEKQREEMLENVDDRIASCFKIQCVAGVFEAVGILRENDYNWFVAGVNAQERREKKHRKKVRPPKDGEVRVIHPVTAKYNNIDPDENVTFSWDPFDAGDAAVVMYDCRVKGVRVEIDVDQGNPVEHGRYMAIELAKKAGCKWVIEHTRSNAAKDLLGIRAQVKSRMGGPDPY